MCSLSEPKRCIRQYEYESSKEKNSKQNQNGKAGVFLVRAKTLHTAVHVYDSSKEKNSMVSITKRKAGVFIVRAKTLHKAVCIQEQQREKTVSITKRKAGVCSLSEPDFLGSGAWYQPSSPQLEQAAATGNEGFAHLRRKKRNHAGAYPAMSSPPPHPQPERLVMRKNESEGNKFVYLNIIIN